MVTENIKQLLLSDGSEIICRIEEELEDDLIISNAYKIVRVEAALSGSSYYTFKPFMTFVEENSHLISLNLYHIISATVPFDELHGQYVKIMASVKEIMNKDKIENDEFDESKTLDEALEEYSNVVSIDRNKLH